jgi:transcriptional regulator with XRE-family HTH domain
MDLGRNIYLQRIKHGLSQEQLAARLNVSRQTIYKWESNIAIPRADNIMMMVKVFEISYDEMFAEDPEE